MFALVFIPAEYFCNSYQDVIEKTIKMSERLKIPSKYADLLLLIIKYFNLITTETCINAEKILTIIEKLDAYRRKNRFLMCLSAMKYLAEFVNNKTRNLKILEKSYNNSKIVDAKIFVKQGFKGKNIALKVREARLEKIQFVLI